MKATELMINDWVYGLYPNGSRYANPFCISAVDIYPLNESPRIVTYSGYGFQEEHLAPIPITPEILEKNGWYYDDIDGEWRGCGLNIGGYNPEEYTILDGRCIRYVHELQHALKLCGIEKEITL